MKILYICTSIDSYLIEQVLALQYAKHQVDILDILEYKLIFDNGKTIHIRPKTKFKLLENFFVLDEVNEHIRRREIFDYLDRYDIVNLYKCAQYAVEFKDKIENISLKYIITPNEILPRKKSKVDELFSNSKLFILENDRIRQSFNHTFGYENKSITLYKPVKFLHDYDSIDKKVYEEFLTYLNLSEKNFNIFCHFKGSIHKQKELIISLANLPLEIKKISTFLLYMDNENKILNKNLLLLLQDIKLDYVVINNNSTDEQIAMLLKVSKASVFIDHSPFNTVLITSLYAKNHPFIFKANNIDPLFKRNKIFLDNFSEFSFIYEKDEINESLFKEIYRHNREKIYMLFSYEGFEERFINATLQ